MTATGSCVGALCKGKRPKRPVEVLTPEGGYCGPCNAARLDKMEKEAVERIREAVPTPHDVRAAQRELREGPKSVLRAVPPPGQADLNAFG